MPFYIGTSVIEAVGITYAAKAYHGTRPPFVKYPDKIHVYGAPGCRQAAHSHQVTQLPPFSWQHLFQSLIPNGMSSLLRQCGLGSRVCPDKPRSTLSKRCSGRSCHRSGCAFANIYIKIRYYSKRNKTEKQSFHYTKHLLYQGHSAIL